MNQCCKCNKPFMGKTVKIVVCSECKKLASARRQSEWRTRHPQKEKTQQQNWYRKNKEYVKQCTKQWQSENPEKVKLAATQREFPTMPLPMVEVVVIHRQLKKFIKERNNVKNS